MDKKTLKELSHKDPAIAFARIGFGIAAFYAKLLSLIFPSIIWFQITLSIANSTHSVMRTYWLIGSIVVGFMLLSVPFILIKAGKLKPKY